jgi:hypothetical protein
MKAYFKALDKRENKQRLISTGDEDYSSHEEAVEDVKNVLQDVQYMKLISPILTVVNGGKNT